MPVYHEERSGESCSQVSTSMVSATVSSISFAATLLSCQLPAVFLVSAKGVQLLTCQQRFCPSGFSGHLFGSMWIPLLLSLFLLSVL